MTNFLGKLTGQNNEETEEELYEMPQEENEENESEEDEDTLITIDKEDKEEWVDRDQAEGQLSVDVYQTKDSVIIKSTIAGVKPEDIDISIDNDVITIRGTRKQQESIKEDDYFYQECYWGSFSRSIVLPVEINSEETDASLKNGVLTITLPKVKKSKSVAVKVKQND